MKAEETSSTNPRPVFLQGRKVILRPVLKSDLGLTLQWVNDPKIRVYLDRFMPVTERDEEKWLEFVSSKNDTNITLIIDRGSKMTSPIGVISLNRIDWRDGVAHTGTLIGDSGCHSQGYATDAKMTLLHHAFNTMGLRKICSNAVADNKASIRYSSKCGYKKEGVLKAHAFRNGEYRDIVQLAVFREGFMEAWKRYNSDK